MRDLEFFLDEFYDELHVELLRLHEGQDSS